MLNWLNKNTKMKRNAVLALPFSHIWTNSGRLGTVGVAGRSVRIQVLESCSRQACGGTAQALGDG